MRFLFMAMILASHPGHAQTFIEADRILGIFGATEYADNLLNDDAYVDLSVLAISENRQSVDLYFAVSEPETGQLMVREIARKIMPYYPAWRGDVRYSIHPHSDAYLPTVFVESVSSQNKFQFMTFPNEKGSVIANAEIFQRDKNDRQNLYSCDLNYVFPYDPEIPPKGRVIDQNGTEIALIPGAPPVMTNWSYADFAESCPGAPPVFPALPHNSRSKPQQRPGPKIDITRVLSVDSTTDWNGNGSPDHLLLVLSDSGTSADLLTFVSDAASGTLNYWSTIPSVLPTTWPFQRDAGNILSIYAQEDQGVYQPSVWAQTNDLNIQATLAWRTTGWEIVGIDYHDYNERLRCVFDYTAGVGKIDQPETDLYQIDIGAPPVLAPNWWEKIPAEGCVIRG